MSANHEFEKSLPYNSEKGCPDGYHKRKEYTTDAGTYVPPRCVRSTTKYKESQAERRSALKRKQTRRLMAKLPTIKSISRKNCPPGMIPRKAYVRRYSTAIRQRGFTVKKSSGKQYRVYPTSKSLLVESRCVKNTGLPGKGPQGGVAGVGPLRKGELAKHGYSFRRSESQRHAALKAAVEEYGALGVYRKLDAVSKLTVRTIPDAAKVFKEDKEWVKSHFGPLKAF